MADLLPHKGVGKELREILELELGIPKTRVKWFEVRFAAGEPVKVKCEFYPSELPPDADEDDDTPEPSHGSLDD